MISKSRFGTVIHLVGALLLWSATAAATAGTFTVLPWQNDLTSGISELWTYTHAYNFQGNPVAVNGVNFTGSSGANPSAGNFSTSGFASVYGPNDANNITGNSYELARRFIYNGDPQTVTLTGLTPGESYSTTLYSVGWEASGRTAIISAGGDNIFVDQDNYGDNNGIRVRYDFVADGGGSQTLSIDPQTTGTWHVYGFSNRTQTLSDPNRSFEHPDVTGVNGGSGWSYLNNDNLPGWEIGGDVNKVGVARQGSPWANNGVIPDGDQVGYIQSSGGGAGTLSHTITDLTPGEIYRVSYDYNMRAGYATPQISVTLDGDLLQQTSYNGVGGSNPYFHGAYQFTATGPTATIVFANTAAAGDSTVTLDNLRITPAASNGWTISPWTGDADSGVDGARHYSHALNFNSANSPTVNGVLFKGTSGGNPGESVGGANYSTSGMSSATGDPSNNVGGNSAVLAAAFNYGGATSGFTLSGLLPGQTYDTTVFGVGWDTLPTSRRAAFSVNGSDPVTFEENLYNNNNGVRYTYRGQATEAGQVQLSAAVQNPTFTWHYYAASNAFVKPELMLIGDAFAGPNGTHNGSLIQSIAPDHANVPGASTYVATGFNNAFNTQIVNGTAQMGANAGAGISLLSAGDYKKPNGVEIQADLSVGSLAGAAGQNARGTGLGFYNFASDPGNIEVAIGFSGLVLAPDGGLYAYRNVGTETFSTAIAFDGTFNPNSFYTLSYDVDFRDGTVSNIALEGSSADYGLLEAFANGWFDHASTQMAAFTGSSTTGGTFGFVDNFIVNAIIPEPRTVVLALLGAAAVVLLVRRRRSLESGSLES